MVWFEFLLGDFSQGIIQSLQEECQWAAGAGLCHKPQVTQHKLCLPSQVTVLQGLTTGQSQVVAAANPINSLRRGKVIGQFQGLSRRQGQEPKHHNMGQSRRTLTAMGFRGKLRHSSDPVKMKENCCHWLPWAQDPPDVFLFQVLGHAPQTPLGQLWKK